MLAWEANELGERVASLVQDGQVGRDLSLLEPILAQRTPFRLLGRIGERVGAGLSYLGIPQGRLDSRRVAAERCRGI